MIEKGNFSYFNLVRTRELSECGDADIVSIISNDIESFPLISKLLTETTMFYAESFQELRKYIKREKRLVVFDTPSRVKMTHEYTIEGAGQLEQGFHFLFNTTERLSWLKVYLEEKRISIASKEIVISLLKKKLGDELNRLSSMLHEDITAVAYRLYYASDGKPCFVEYNQKEHKGQQSLLLSITFFDSIRNREVMTGAKSFSPLKEKLITYNYETLTGDASAWIYFKAPANFVLKVNHDIDAQFVDPSHSNDDEITSIVFTPNGMPLSATIEISVEVPMALFWWYNIMLYVSVVVALTCFGFLMASFKFTIPQPVVDILNNISFAMVAALIATRGWLMSEEQVMKRISNWYAVLVGVMMLLIFSLTVTKAFGSTSECLDCSTNKQLNKYNEEVDNKAVSLHDTIKEQKAMIGSLQLTIDTLRQAISSQNATIVSMQESLGRHQAEYNKIIKERDDMKSPASGSNKKK